jgi:hypothetical protein
MQLAQSSLNTLLHVPALAANNGNIPSSEQSGAATLLDKQNFDSESNSESMQASADRVNKFDRTKATTRTVTCGRYNLRIPSTWFPVDSDSDSEDHSLPANACENFLDKKIVNCLNLLINALST